MKRRGHSLLNPVRRISGRDVLFYFVSKRRLVKAIQSQNSFDINLSSSTFVGFLFLFFFILHFFASSLSFLLKNRTLLAVVLGLFSSLCYCLLHNQRLISSTFSLIYAVISFTRRNRLGFCNVLLVVIMGYCSDDPYYWGFFTFFLHPPYRVRTQILQNPLSSIDYFQLSFRYLAKVTCVIAIEGVEVVDSPHFSRGSPISWVGLVEGPQRPILPVCLFLTRRYILMMKYFERDQGLRSRG